MIMFKHSNNQHCIFISSKVIDQLKGLTRVSCFCIEQSNLEFKTTCRHNYEIFLGIGLHSWNRTYGGQRDLWLFQMKGEPSPQIRGDSHKHDYVNFSHPLVTHIITISSVEIEQPRVDKIQEDVEVLESPCGDGVWHVERCPFMSHVHFFTLQKSTKHSCAVRIVVNPISINVFASIYSGLWSQFLGAPLKLHKF
jgi:hypothetical protein